MASTALHHVASNISDSDSDCEHGAAGDNPLRHADLSDSIFKPYLEFTGRSSAATTSADISKIQSFLTSSSSGALSCLICLERIKRSDPTWSCSSLCFSVFHLICIQSWARQSTDLAAARSASRLSISADKASESATWNCPKCRSEYTKPQIPKSYLCFCGKLEDPYSEDPWILPHSCGEICNRSLRNNCGHHCLLLCHPGPCPPCPQVVEASCFCGAVKEPRRCGFKSFACENSCNKPLDCRTHRCSEKCHDGLCTPCRRRGVYQCQCGKLELNRECCERVFRCDSPCNKPLYCGKHVCTKGCHAEECGDCLLQGKRTCPCGKKAYEGMPCDVTVPLCGGTCDKLLTCGFHHCPERCHRGPCIETCRLVVTKMCRCRSLRKEVPCYQDLTCERKCMRMRDCSRHACKRRCCDGDCPPCSEICDKKLRCKNHKCPSPCHRGACAPCPVMVTISCSCGETKFEVPCGTEMDQKPPRCPKPCSVPQLCRHAPYSKPHKCHYGACPQCRRLCEEEYQCGHKCKLRCHGPRPPPNLEFTVKPKKKKSNRPNECTPGSQCPPCPELLWRSCVGQHGGAERMMVCSDRKQFSCDNLCGNPLSCGNHYCTKTCHVLKSHSLAGEACNKCSLPCQKERRPECQHTCPLSCHPGDCPPCKVLVKRSCHCGSMVHVFKCIYYNSLSVVEQLAVRSCGGPCHRKLPYCTHLCPETCHPGQCPSPEKCCKKVAVRCGCQTLKKEWICQDVQAAYHQASKDIPKNHFGHGLIPCDSSKCKSKLQGVLESELQLRSSRPKVAAEEKESDAEKSSAPKRRRRRERMEVPKGSSKLQLMYGAMKGMLVLVTLVVVFAAGAYYGYKGLLSLSDWMNEADRQSSRYHRRQT